MVFLDRYGWPVEIIKGKWIQNILRLLVHTKSVKRGSWNGYKIIKYRRVKNERR